MRRGAPAVLGVLLALILSLVAGPAAAAAADAGAATSPGAAGDRGAALVPVAAQATVTRTVTTTAPPLVRDGPADASKVQTPSSLDEVPRGHEMTARQAQTLARADPKMQEVRRENPGSYDRIFLKGQLEWQLSVYKKGKPLTEIGQVVINDATQRITGSWDVPYVAWTMARGIDGAFGRSITNPWLWGTLLVLFLVPFVGVRPLRGPPVPLLILAGFTAPLAFFNNARLDWAVPLSFGLLLALCVWATVRGIRRPRSAPRPLSLLLPTGVLLVGAIGLFVFRVVLNVEDGNVIDVGYAGVVGADKIGRGLSAYGDFPANVGTGNTYGPLNYLAYVPFEQVFPFRGSTSFSEPAAHAASIAFDALAAVVLFLVGRSQEQDRDAGHRRGLLYTYLWLACPWTAYCLNSNANDALPAAMLGLVLLAGARPALRGLAAGAAGAAKIAPFVALPVLMTGRQVAPTVPVHHAPPSIWEPAGGERSRGRLALPGIGRGALLLAAAVVFLVVGAIVALRGTDFQLLFDRTIGYQAGRPAPFMPWGFPDYDLQWARDYVRYLAVGFAIVVALVPRRHDVTGTAALVLAVIVGLQMATEYWFYLYLVWLIPLVLVAAMADRPLRWPGIPLSDRPTVVPRMHGPVAEEDAPWAADVRRREAARVGEGPGSRPVAPEPGSSLRRSARPGSA